MRGRNALFPEFDELERAEHELTAKLDLARRRYATRSATPTPLTGEWLDELWGHRFDEPVDLEDLLDWTINAMDTGNVQMTHPGHLGLYNPAPSFAAECADRIIATFNPQISVYTHAPAAVEIEHYVINQVARRMGLHPNAGGHFTSGGTESNAAALLCALHAICPAYAEHGIRAFLGRPLIYASRESHLAWLKIAQSAGIGREAVRLVETDGSGRMDPLELERAIERDLIDGGIPVMIAATAGTTNAGMIDPLHDAADLAAHYGAWFHVDAAWGGAIVASGRFAYTMSGIERADSITVDAHKWLATTMGAGIFLTAHTDVPADVFNVSASYMPAGDAPRDFYLNSAQWSRRFVGLRLFLSLGAAGWDGYAEHVERSIRLTDRLTTTLECHGWLHANDSQLGVTCMVPPEGPEAVEEYVEAVNADGRFWVSRAVFERSDVLRACVTNGRTDETVIDELAALLVSIRTYRVRDSIA